MAPTNIPPLEKVGLSRSDVCVEGNDGVVTLLCLRAATVVAFKPVKKR